MCWWHLSNKIKNPKSGRQKYLGNCSLCNCSETSRWYRKAIKDKVICKSCYDKFKREDSTYRTKRNKQRTNWDIENQYKSFLNQIKHKKATTNIEETQYLELISKNCYYCDGNLNKFGIKLDRIDNTKSYLVDNVVQCCRKCNVAKNNMLQNDFIEMCIKIAQKYSSACEIT